jgi:hypothetical protein
MAVKRVKILLRGQAARWYNQAMREPRNPLFPAVWQRLNDIRIGSYKLEAKPGDSGTNRIEFPDGTHIYLGWTCGDEGVVKIRMIELE